VPERHRGHGTLYDAVNHDRITVSTLDLPGPFCTDDRITADEIQDTRLRAWLGGPGIELGESTPPGCCAA
jgi:hypothetical protein